jgi:hypothetical protein
VSTKSRTNLPVYLWTFPEAQLDTSVKLVKEQDLMRKLEKKIKLENSDFQEQVEAAVSSKTLPVPWQGT